MSRLLFLLFATGVSGLAQIGESLEACKSIYGEPVADYEPIGPASFVADRVYRFKMKNFDTIKVGFKDGVTVLIQAFIDSDTKEKIKDNVDYMQKYNTILELANKLVLGGGVAAKITNRREAETPYGKQIETSSHGYMNENTAKDSAVSGKYFFVTPAGLSVRFLADQGMFQINKHQTGWPGWPKRK